jgi:AraC family transcriptional regulator
VLAATQLRLSHYRAGTAMSPHEHDEPSIGIVLSGAFLERIGKDERTYSKGTASYCPAATAHSQVFGHVAVRQVIFTLDDSGQDYLQDCKAGLGEAPHYRSAMFSELATRLLNEMRHNDRFSRIAREGILLEVIAAFGRNKAATATTPKPPPWLRAAREFMHENPCVPLTMAQIAQEAGRHEIHLAREFRRFFGCSVGTYMRRLRIDRAEQLLLEPDATISEVALNCGFASHSHLCREFKVRFGVTPSEYRSDRRE